MLRLSRMLPTQIRSAPNQLGVLLAAAPHVLLSVSASCLGSLLVPGSSLPSEASDALLLSA